MKLSQGLTFGRRLFVSSEQNNPFFSARRRHSLKGKGTGFNDSAAMSFELKLKEDFCEKKQL
jgi:hypothetical protein